MVNPLAGVPPTGSRRRSRQAVATACDIARAAPRISPPAWPQGLKRSAPNCLSISCKVTPLRSSPSISGEQPAADSPLRSVQFAPAKGGASPAEAEAEAAAAAALPAAAALDCVGKLAKLAALIVVRILNFIGFQLPSKVTTTLVQNLQRVPSRVVTLCKASARAIAAASGLARATEIAKLGYSIYSNYLSDILSAIKAGLSWYDWAVAGAKIILNVGVMAAGGGLGAILKVVNAIYSSLDLALALVNAVRNCA
jgi:hypothetical protein